MSLPLDKATALQLLDSDKPHERLRAARFFAQHVLPNDIPSIENALRKENVLWIRNSLRDALRVAASPGAHTPQSVIEVVPREAAEDGFFETYDTAVYEATSLLLHEIEPLIGALRVYALREVQDFDHSKTRQQLDLIDALLASMAELRKASAPPDFKELNLSELISRACTDQKRDAAMEVQLAGPETLMVVGDEARLWLAISNGIRNAIEATLAVDRDRRGPIVINWNRTDIDYWVVVLDSGIGIKGDPEKLFEVGTTLKRDHLGMGLPTTKLAMASMSGTAVLAPRNGIGTKFEIRWPKIPLPMK